MSVPGKGTLPGCPDRAEIAWTMGAIEFQFAVCAPGLSSDGSWPLGQAFLMAQRPTVVTRSERLSSPSSRPEAVLVRLVAAYTALVTFPALRHTVVTLSSVEIDELCVVSPLATGTTHGGVGDCVGGAKRFSLARPTS
jgi:hypothetical protein